MVVCSKCREENPERARFCLACGTALESIGLAGEERKVVSVLFADLVGFTGLSENIDPEEVRSTLTPYFAALKKEIERFGGTVEKFIGDAVMAVFGAPTAHEDDPERAVRAALRIPEAVEELNRKRSHPLSVRVAVNTGEVLVTLGVRSDRGEGMVAGDVVNTASRLQSAAPADGVVVGEHTYRATNAVIDYEPLPPVTLKGKTAPVPVWLARSARSRFGTDVQRYASAFVGRDHEGDQLKAAFSRSLRESSVQLVTIVGEPGVGKSRLVSEFSEWVDERPEIVSWRQGRCLPYGEGITFWALGEILKAQTGVLESDTPDEAAQKLDEAIAVYLGDSGEEDWFRGKLGPLIGLETSDASGGERQEAFTAWQRFLEAVAARRPLVLVFEDLHWADDPLLEFVEQLVEWSSGVPILVVCTARPEVYQQHPSWGGGKRNSTTISLGPLSDEETAAMVAGLLAQAVLPAETQKALLDRAGGNPLYAEEFVRMLTDRGFLERSGSVVHVRDPEQIPVPESIHALIAARLDTLAPDLKAIVYDASVIGKVFWSGAIAHMGSGSTEDVRTALHQLVKKEFFRPARISSVAGEEEFSFWHVLIRDVAYNRTPRPLRRQKHEAVAGWIETVAGDRVRDQAELLTHHYEQALQLAEAAGADAEIKGLKDAVARYSIMAADRAVDLDPEIALGYFERGVDLLPDDDIRRGGILRQMSLAAAGIGKSQDAARFAQAAIATFERLGDVFAVAEASAFHLAVALHVTGRKDEGYAATKRALSLLEQRPPGPELGTTYVAIAGEHMMSGRCQESLDRANQAISLYENLEEGGPAALEGLAASRITPPYWHQSNNLERHRAMSFSFRGISRCELGDLGGLDDLRAAIELSRKVEGQGLPVSIINLADFTFWIDGPAEGRSLLDEARDLAMRRGLIRLSMWASAESTWVLYDSGEWDELIRRADQIIDWGGETEELHATTMAATYKALVLLHRGRVREAAELAETFVQRGRQIADPQIWVPAATAGSLIHSANGDHDEAKRLVAEVVEISKGRGFFKNKMLPDLVSVLIAAGSPMDDLDPVFEEVPGILPRDQHSLISARALAAEYSGDISEAAGSFRAAAERWGDYGNPFEQGKALLGRARCLVALGDPGEVREILLKARSIFDRLQALPLLSDTDSVLRVAEGAAS